MDAAEIKKYMNPLVAAATLGCKFRYSSTGTITKPAPTPSIPAINPAANPLNEKKIRSNKLTTLPISLFFYRNFFYSK